MPRRGRFGGTDSAPISAAPFGHLRYEDLKDTTVYANFGTVTDQLTFAIYRPEDKQNENRVHIPGYKSSSG